MQSEDSLRVVLKALGPYHHFECLVLQAKCEREDGVYRWSNSAECVAGPTVLNLRADQPQATFFAAV